MFSHVKNYLLVLLYSSTQFCGSGSAWIWKFCLDQNPEFKFLIRIQQKVKENINKTVNFGLFVLGQLY